MFCQPLKMSRIRRMRNKEELFPDNIFLFKFCIFWKFRYRFSYRLNKVFLKSFQYFRKHNDFLLKFWHTMKQVWGITLQWRYTRHIFWHVPIPRKSVNTWKWRNVGYMDLKKSYFLWQKHGFIWNRSIHS